MSEAACYLNGGNYVGLYPYHQMNLHPAVLVLPTVADVLPPDHIRRSKARRVNGEVALYAFKGRLLSTMRFSSIGVRSGIST